MMGVSDPGCSVTLPSQSNNNPDKGATKRSPGTQVAMEGGVARQSLSHMPTRPFPFRLAEQRVFAHDTHISDRVIGSSLPRQVSHGSRHDRGNIFFWGVYELYGHTLIQIGINPNSGGSLPACLIQDSFII